MITQAQIDKAKNAATKAQNAYDAAKKSLKRPGSKVTNLEELFIAQEKATNTVNSLMEKFLEQHGEPPKLTPKSNEDKDSKEPTKRTSQKAVTTSQEMSPSERARLGYPPFTRTESEKELNLQKDIDAATAKRDAKTKIAKAEAKAEAKVDRQIAQDLPVTSSTSKRKEETKKAKDAEIKKQFIAKSRRDNTTKKDAVETLKQFKAKGRRENEDPRDSVTKFMEELLGLNRSASQIEKDLKVTEELESRDRGGMKRGGRAKKPSVSRKTYAMNRGGKVASVRKPTRA